MPAAISGNVLVMTGRTSLHSGKMLRRSFRAAGSARSRLPRRSAAGANAGITQVADAPIACACIRPSRRTIRVGRRPRTCAPNRARFLPARLLHRSDRRRGQEQQIDHRLIAVIGANGEHQRGRHFSDIRRCIHARARGTIRASPQSIHSATGGRICKAVKASDIDRAVLNLADVISGDDVHVRAANGEQQHFSPLSSVQRRSLAA